MTVPSFLLPWALSCFALADPTDPDERIARVESGLRSAIILIDEPGWTLQERMAHYGVPAVGIAVVHGGKLAWHRVYGVKDRETGEPATTSTLFQAASISKPVSASAALKLAAAKEVSIEEDVNRRLLDWKLPENEFTRETAVTVALLLCHRAGTTVHGFGGYAQGAPVPTVVDVLDGRRPANSAAVRVGWAPDTVQQYSGGGFTIVQKWMTDLSGEPFAALLEELVLGPVGMFQSTFEQPLSDELHDRAAAGVYPDGMDVPGNWHTYRAQAAAGLWTTAGDLGLFVAEFQKALRGESELFSRDLAERMVPEDPAQIGLGFFTMRMEDDVYFGHGGWNDGFSSELIAHRDDGYGAVVMTNANQPDFINEVLQAIRVEYKWGGTPTYRRQALPPEARDSLPGRYRFDAEQALVVYAEGEQLFSKHLGGEGHELVYVGEGQFVRRDRPLRFSFDAKAEGMALRIDGPDGVSTHRRLGADELLPREILFEGRFDEALAAYRKVLVETPADSAVAEATLNGEGYGLLGSGEIAHAIELFRVVTELYPQSANAWDSLGEAYRAHGDQPRAIECYAAALERDPEFPTALQALAELRAE